MIKIKCKFLLLSIIIMNYSVILSSYITMVTVLLYTTKFLFFLTIFTVLMYTVDKDPRSKRPALIH